MAEHIGSLIWFLLCIFFGLKRILFEGLPDVRARVRAGKGTPEDFVRLRKQQMLGYFLIILGVATALPDALRLFTD
jgi:hypothetical protein